MNKMNTEAVYDLRDVTARELNLALHDKGRVSITKHWSVVNPDGRHAIAVGISAPITVEVNGHVGYYCAGMNDQATVIVKGNAGVGVAENMMSGFVHVKGDASQSAGATAHGGLLLVEGNASARCGISMKGVDIVVKGNIGHMSAFMGQAGSLVVFGDAGDALGDSIYEAKLFVRGKVASLGADCIEKEMAEGDKAFLFGKLKAAGVAGDVDVSEFKRYGSARRLYNFHVDNVDAY